MGNNKAMERSAARKCVGKGDGEKCTADNWGRCALWGVARLQPLWCPRDAGMIINFVLKRKSSVDRFIRS